MPAYLTDYFDTWKPTNWQANGTIGVSGDRLTSSDAAGGTAMSLPQPSAYFYEIFAQVRLLQSGGRYTILARASADARYGTVTAGSFYAVDFSNVVMSGTSGTATMKIVKRVGGVLTQVAQLSVGVKDWMNVRVLVRPGGSQGFLFSVSLDDRHTYYGEGDAALTSGKPGLGVAGAAAVNGFENVWLYNYESAAPTPVLAADIASSVSSTAVDLQWKGSFDGADGSGTWQYDVYRNNQYVRSTRYATFTDNTLSPSTPYQYFIVAMDFHLNQVVGSTIVITTPGAGSFDAHRNGVEPNGTYWGGGSENIDVQSGNLNYTLPLLKAVGRGQTSVQLALSYNSQNWRKDATGTPSYWKLGRDIGYGFGWRLQAGSMTAYFSDWWTVHHWVYTDATGAEYRLDQQSGGLFTSKEGIYVTFDANVGKLRFNDGSWWSFGALSTGGEEDAGTFYPTLMQDSNGNQVVLSYQSGIGAGWPNSSGRLAQINDAVSGMAAPAFSFTYVDQGDGTVPHLQSITSVAGRESYTFSSSSQAMHEPFDNGDFGSAWMLTGITNTSSSITTTLAYSPSGEMTSATLPYHGKLEWEYSQFTYANQKIYREVSNRYLTPTEGGARWRYELVSPAETTQMHSYRAVIDWGADSVKQYWMNTGATLPYAGVVYVYQVRRNNGGGNVTNGTLLSHTEYTWALNGTNPYVSTVTTTRDDTTTKEQQWLDGFGNITQRRVYDKDLLLANARTYKYAYLSDAGYTSSTGLHIRNRLTSATLTAGGQVYTLATNTYDGFPAQDNWAADPDNRRLNDAAYGTSYLYRGNLRTSWTMSSQTTRTMTYDIGGNVIQTTGGGGPQVDATFANGSNYLLPATITPNSQANLATSAQWDSLLRLSSVTGPNGATTSVAGYDAASRPGTTTSATGAVTSFTYSNSAPQVRATVNQRWTETYYDGLGRTVEVRSGVGTEIKSIVETKYAPCGCSPLGKVSQVSRPFTPNDTVVYWTTYEYDALGRTTRVIQPGNSGTTTYTYWGNLVTVTDPGGKWRALVTDGFGNLVLVIEPNPAGGANYNTTYTYNAFNQLTTVSMPRPTGTQTRSFVYNAQGQLTSVTQPETGTTTYGYDSTGKPSWKRDAKQQLTELSYDAYNRTTQILRYKRVAGADVLDPAQKTVYSYDSAVNGWGRLGSVSTYQHFGDLTGATPIVESFEYTTSGLVSKKSLNVTGVIGPVDVTYGWDNEGRPVWQKYQDAGPRFTWGYDSMGRLSTMTETNVNGNWVVDLVTGTTYNAAGQMTYLAAPGDSETRTYNVLGQLAHQLGLGKNIEYRYSTTANDGRITHRKDWVSGEEVAYQYDALGRLSSAETPGDQSTDWGLNFTYDGFGNKTHQQVRKGTVPTHEYVVDAATNRLTEFGYDANGNVTSGLLSLPGTYSYDGENRMVDNGKEKYGYGAGNRRLWKKRADGVHEVYLYGLGGELLEVFEATAGNPWTVTRQAGSQRAWFGGRLMRVGTERVNADRLGTYENTYPYGELVTATPASKEKFATYWRDAGTGLDYAVNRYYSPQMGRFLSADPYQASGGPANPGSWNRYAYVGGDPVNFNDSAGLYQCSVTGSLEQQYLHYSCSDGNLRFNLTFQLTIYGLAAEYLSDFILASMDMHARTAARNYFASRAIGKAHEAARFIGEKWTWSRECEELLDRAGTSSIGLQNAARQVAVSDGTTSLEPLYGLYANAAEPPPPSAVPGTVADKFSASPNTHAMADLNGNRVFINPSYFNSLELGGAIMTMAHELLHNAGGMIDEDIQTRWGLPTDQGSFNISVKLFTTCFN
ncbi:MAG TPA: RHS repeat-associated core domain-containing protein [Paludibaculum sp.]